MKKTGFWLTLAPPGQIETVVPALQSAGLLPEKHTWWFGWHDLDIVLPRPFCDRTELRGEWHTLRLFSEPAELRLERRGRDLGWWLLLEAEEQKLEETLGEEVHGWLVGEPRTYEVEEGCHLLAGRKLELPRGPARGEILFPRLLDYGSEGADLDLAVVADVRKYYDATYRLVTVRYAGLKTVKPGSIRVPRFPEPGEVMQRTPAVHSTT